MRGKSTFSLAVRSLIAIAIAVGLTTPVASAKVPSNRERKAIKNLCAALLTNPETMDAVPVGGARGLYVLATETYGAEANFRVLLRNARTNNNAAFHPHELTSSAKYASEINRQYGESLLLVPGIENKSIPGFDGVILNAKGEPVANYSLKTMISSRSEHGVLDRASEGASQAKRFSFMEEWMRVFKVLAKDEQGYFHIPADGLSPKELSATKQWLANSFGLFGLSTSVRHMRPTRVVVDIQSKAPMPMREDIVKLERIVRNSNGLIESIIVMKQGEVLEIR